MTETKHFEPSGSKISFDTIADRETFLIKNAESDTPLAEISGYDLKIAFNFEYINSLEDVEAAISGLSQMFRDIIMDQLISDNKSNS